MKQHHYRIQVDHLRDTKGQPVSREPLVFEIGNHDDIFHIVDLVKARADFAENTSTSFAVGLKLFSEVILEHKDHPLFEEFGPQFVQFMKRLKGKK